MGTLAPTSRAAMRFKGNSVASSMVGTQEVVGSPLLVLQLLAQAELSCMSLGIQVEPVQPRGRDDL